MNGKYGRVAMYQQEGQQPFFAELNPEQMAAWRTIPGPASNPIKLIGFFDLYSPEAVVEAFARAREQQKA